MSSIKQILTTHAGSLPRPKPLTQLYADRVAGLEIDESMLSDRAYQATKWVIEQQKLLGLICLTMENKAGRHFSFIFSVGLGGLEEKENENLGET